MTPETPADTSHSDSEARAQLLIERGIAHAEAGEHEDALADLIEAQHCAAEAGDDELVTITYINQGFAHTMNGDSEEAARLYGQAAELARTAEDTARLKIALANLSVEMMSLERYEDVIAALTEYLGLVPEDDAEALTRAYVNRAASYLTVGDNDSAFADLSEAERIAEEAEDPELIYLVRMNQGYQYAQNSDPNAAYIVLEQAVDYARTSGDAEERRDALMSLAHVSRTLQNTDESERLFADAADACRQLEDRATLADALYWQGMVLRSMKQSKKAILLWGEAAEIRRDLDQPGHLADCLFAQADTLRADGSHEAADPLYAEAADKFGEMEMHDVLADVMYSWAQSLWASGRPVEAAVRADEAIRLATATGDLVTARKAQGLKAMAAADSADWDAAREALDAAEELCRQSSAYSAMVWALARRAYVLAKEGRDPAEVVEQLKQAHQYGIEQGQLAASRSAIRKIGSYIITSCDEKYVEPLTAFGTSSL